MFSSTPFLFNPRVSFKPIEPPIVFPSGTVLTYTGSDVLYTVPANTWFLQIRLWGGGGGSSRDAWRYPRLLWVAVEGADMLVVQRSKVGQAATEVLAT